MSPDLTRLSRGGAALGFVGLLAGGLGGWILLLSGDDVAKLAALSATLYYALAALLPLSLAALAVYWKSEGVAPDGPLRLAALGAVGALLASAAWLVGLTQIPAIYGSVDREALLIAVRGAALQQVAIVAAICVVTGAVIGLRLRAGSDRTGP